MSRRTYATPTNESNTLVMIDQNDLQSWISGVEAANHQKETRSGQEAGAPDYEEISMSREELRAVGRNLGRAIVRTLQAEMEK
ncbi:MAG: hypothetical protein HQL50_15395 [Magnetococcales bacterium]|nr:hypothetical protein [Magnetococcales bacterium]